jgi:hypothetical protein
MTGGAGGQQDGSVTTRAETMWVYINSEPGLWTVGFYDPSGHFHTDSDHVSPTDAADRVHYLNGSNTD